MVRVVSDGRTDSARPNQGGERKVQAATKMRGLEHLQGRFPHQISRGQGGKREECGQVRNSHPHRDAQFSC